MLLTIWLVTWTTRVACRRHWPLALGTSSAQFTVYRLRHSLTNQPVVQLPGRLSDQFPKVWRSFVYRPRRPLKYVPRDCIVLVWPGAVRSATHGVSWASCWKLDSIFSLNIFNAEKMVGGHVKKSITSLFFDRIIFHLENSKQLLRKQRKSLGGYFILPHPVHHTMHIMVLQH